MEEQGDYALSHVSRYMDSLRAAGDHKSAALWSMVLAELFHKVEAEKRALKKAQCCRSVVLVRPQKTH